MVMPTQSWGFRSLYHRPILWLAANCCQLLGRAHPGWDSGTEGGPSQHALHARGCPGPLPLHLHLHSLGSLHLLASTLLTPAQGPGPAKAAGVSGVEGLTSQPGSPPGGNTVGILVVTRDAQSWPRFKQRGDVALSGTQTQQISSGGYCMSQNGSHTWVTNARG